MGQVQYDQTMLVRVLAGYSNAVASSPARCVVVVDTHVHLVVRDAVQAFGGSGIVVDIVDVTGCRIIAGEEVEFACEGVR